VSHCGSLNALDQRVVVLPSVALDAGEAAFSVDEAVVGLPWETHEDVEGIVTLTEQIRDRMIQVGRARGRVGRIHPSVNPFVPKPGTPYQWLPMEDPKETDRKLQFLRKAFGRMANVDAVIKSARTGVSQSILALADRRVADALEHWCEWIAILRVGGRGEGAKGAPVVGTVRGDDADASRCDARELKGCLDGFGARVSKRDPAQGRRQQRTQRLEEILAGRRVETLVGIRQQRSLQLDGIGHLRVGMPKEIDPVVGHQVEVAPVFVIP